MKEKIKWYREVLELEPNSMLFFALAKMLVQEGNIQEARDVLEKGILRHGEHLEARLLYIEVLESLGNLDECQNQVKSLTEVLGQYTSFWKVWAKAARTSENADLAIAMKILAISLHGKKISFFDLLQRGLESIEKESRLTQKEFVFPEQKEQKKQPIVQLEFPEPQKKQAETILVPQTFSLRTRSMAAVLAEQGDFVGALDIYQELLKTAEPDARPDLEKCIADVKARSKAMGSGSSGIDESAREEETPISSEGDSSMTIESTNQQEANGQKPKHLISILEALADRIEARSMKHKGA